MVLLVSLIGSPDLWLKNFGKNFLCISILKISLIRRQTRFGSIYTGTIDNPVFKDIYAPLDGFVINGGIKLRL